MKKRKDEQKMLSVIIPVYNGEKYLKDMLNSVLDSTYKNMDIILIDDGSSDSSPTICRWYALQDNRIRYIQQENTGIVGARNRGLNEAKGYYIAFVDQDDLISADFYEEAITKIEETGSDLCIASSAKFFRNIKADSYIYEYENDNVIENKNIPEALILPSILMGFYTELENGKRSRSTIWNIVFKKILLENNGIKFKRFVNFEDDLLMRFDLFLNSNRVCTISKIGYYWRTNYDSESCNIKYIVNIDKKWEQVSDYIINELKKKGLDNIAETYKAGEACNEIIEIYRYELIAKRRRKDRKIYLEGIVSSRLTPDAIRMIDYLDKSFYLGRGILKLVAKKKYLMAFYYEYIFVTLRKLFNKIHITDIYKRYVH